ncbi:MAG: hypothetical protein ACK5IJ_01200 [Mangrovibacterium sp.]
MEFGTTFFGIVLLALFSLPIILSVISKNKRQKKMLVELNSFAGSYDCKIDEFELAAKYSIGIDKNSNRLFFISTIETPIVQQVVDLTQVRNCTVVKRSSENSEYGLVIERLALSLNPNNKMAPKIELEFYNADAASQLLNELKSVNSWCEKLSSFLKA